MVIAAGSGDGCLLAVRRLREQTIGMTHVLCADFNSLLFSTRALLLPLFGTATVFALSSQPPRRIQ
jgi:hypothetical protein